MPKFHVRLKELRTSAQLSQQELADKVDMSKSSINMYERGEREPGLEVLEAFADIFNVDLDYLLGKSDVPRKTLTQLPFDNIVPITTKKIPIIGEIACGEPNFTNEDYESYVEVGAAIKADYGLRAHGDSMINARIMDGDIVFIQKQETVNNGEIAAVVIDDRATLKRIYYYPQEGRIILQAENPAYAPLIYEGEELNNIHILGKAVAFQSDVK